jgi:hypothetical protein
LTDLARRTSGMISSFIAHLQSSTYRGEKIGRPRRQSYQMAQNRRDALRASQLANMRKSDGSVPTDNTSP